MVTSMRQYFAVFAVIAFAQTISGSWIKDPYSKTQYLVVQTGMNWYQARAHCLTNEGDLLSLTSLREFSFVNGIIGPTIPNALWLGLNDLNNKYRFEWSDSSPVSFLNWALNEPSGDGENRRCVHIYSHNEFIKEGTFWNDGACSKIFRFICKKPANKLEPAGSAAVTSPAAPPGFRRDCRAGYTSYKSKCYRFFADRLSWQNARQRCRNDGGDLVSYHQLIEYQFVSHMVQSLSDVSFWIGLHDTSTGGRTKYFQWSDGAAVTFTKWNVSQPNTYGFDEICVMQLDSSQQGRWSDVSGSQSLPFVCMRSQEFLPSTATTTSSSSSSTTTSTSTSVSSSSSSSNTPSTITSVSSSSSSSSSGISSNSSSSSQTPGSIWVPIGISAIAVLVVVIAIAVPVIVILLLRVRQSDEQANPYTEADNPYGYVGHGIGLCTIISRLFKKPA